MRPDDVARRLHLVAIMRRLGILLVVVLVIGAGLVASGVIRVHLDVHPPSGADAKPFWREKGGNGGLPDQLGIWVEISRAVRPAVVNISINGPRDLTRRVAATPPGTTATLRIARNGDQRTVDVTLGELRGPPEPRR